MVKYWCPNGCGCIESHKSTAVPYGKQAYYCEVCNKSFVKKNKKELMSIE